MEKKHMAVNKLKNEPTIRPTTPKCALEETALLVPVSGPKIAIGARMTAPVRTPATVAANACQNESPKMMGKAPSTAVAKELEPPHSIRMKSKIVAVRSLSGMDSIPCRSISPLPLIVAPRLVLFAYQARYRHTPRLPHARTSPRVW